MSSWIYLKTSLHPEWILSHCGLTVNSPNHFRCLVCGLKAGKTQKDKLSRLRQGLNKAAPAS